MQFSDLNLAEPILRALREEGYTTPTPIQAQTIPHLLNGKDVLGCAQTGTGKTASFALPILQNLHQGRPSRRLRALILAPTRELAAQIGDSFRAYGRHLPYKTIVIFGGVGQTAQVQALKRGADILIATPGRLLDLLGQGHVRLDTIEYFVLDEADRMLDMGFIHDVRRVLALLPPKRQNLLFSATMPPDIVALASSFLTHPVQIAVTPPATTVETIDQSIFFVEKQQKFALLQHLLSSQQIKRGLIFTRTKHGADKLARQLARQQVQAEVIHGDKSQNARERALAQFKSGRARLLIATDIASRGIDVEGITHVINYDLPNLPESYVHRIGRTARAGAEGIAYSFCDEAERAYLRDIEKTIRIRLTVVEHPYSLSPASLPASQATQPRHDHQPSKSAPKSRRRVRRPRMAEKTPL